MRTKKLTIIIKEQNQYFILMGIFIVALFFIIPKIGLAGPEDCLSGYEWQRMSGVGCVQINCNDIANAHYSYTKACICGSSGSIAENPEDPNKECYYPRDHKSCPGCLYACVHLDKDCPEITQAKPEPKEEPSPKKEEGHLTPEQVSEIIGELGVAEEGDFPVAVKAGFGSGIYNAAKKGFAAVMRGAGKLLKKTTDYELSVNKEAKGFWSGILIDPEGEYIEVNLGKIDLAANKEDGLAAEINIIEINFPGEDNLIDGVSFGVGPGSISKDHVSRDVPGTPISPKINFNTISDYFSDLHRDAKNKLKELPWPLGNREAPFEE